MASIPDWESDNGTQTGSPTKGTTRTTTIANQDWKNIDDATTPYSSSAVVQAFNSYERWIFVKFTGTFNNIFSGLWAHTAGSLPTGVTIKGVVGTAYTTPAVATNAALTVDMTTAISIASGQAVLFGATGPEAAGKAASTNSNPAYTQFLTTQAQTTSSATVGDSAVQTLTLQWNEN